MRKALLSVGVLGIAIFLSYRFLHRETPAEPVDTAGQKISQEESASTFVRFLPLGDLPPFRAKIVDGIRIEQLPSKGSKPPALIHIPMEKSKDKIVELSLGKVSDYTKLNSGAQNFSLYAADNLQDAWLSLRKPKQPVSLVLMLRRPQNHLSSWAQAGLKTIPDDLQSFPHGTLRIINMSIFSPITVEYGKLERHSLLPGDLIVMPGRQQGTRLMLETEKTSKSNGEIIYDNEIEVRENRRTNAFIYTHDRARSRGSVRVKVYNETYQDPFLMKNGFADSLPR